MYIFMIKNIRTNKYVHEHWNNFKPFTDDKENALTLRSYKKAKKFLMKYTHNPENYEIIIDKIHPENI